MFVGDKEIDYNSRTTRKMPKWFKQYQHNGLRLCDYRGNGMLTGQELLDLLQRKEGT